MTRLEERALRWLFLCLMTYLCSHVCLYAILLQTHKINIGWPLLSVEPFLLIGETSARFHSIINLLLSPIVWVLWQTPPTVLGHMGLSGQRATNALVTDIVLFDLYIMLFCLCVLTVWCTCWMCSLCFMGLWCWLLYSSVLCCHLYKLTFAIITLFVDH